MKAKRTRAQLLRAAGEVFGECGYDGATLEAIAARAGVTRPAVNHHFATKSALYREAVECAIVPMLDGAVTKASQPPDLATRLSTFVVETIGSAPDDRSLALFLVTWVLESRRHPELLPAEHDAVSASRAFVTWAVRDAISSGELGIDTDVAGVVDMLLAMIWGIGLYSGRGTGEDSRKILHAFELLLRTTLWHLVDTRASG
ncbi:MAG: TetR/AcrR family transcriptional regulator [Mycobacterium sp.]|nr:TetR/AcrR family transcriptional regulator [Mycobacterium sp.]